ncbi:hypothetical protein NMY22_g10016 [Coprinellus aureogranulatus]|nr:hypothetical protein NMY22_g10016 [Coprinellus aureogranulatus]
METCRLWRSIAVSTPALWSNLYLNLACADRCLLAREELEYSSEYIFENFATMCLTRSASHPLSITISDIYSFEEFPAIIATSTRWKKLTIGLEEMFEMVRSNEFRGFPSLRYLSLDLGLWAGSVIPPKECIAFEAPNLVTLKGVLCVDPHALQISAPNVTHVSFFSARYQRINEMVKLLSTFPRLSHLSLQLEDGRQLEEWPDHRWVYDLLHLRNLSLQAAHAVVWYTLSRCRLPSLKKLRIHMSGTSGLDFPEAKSDINTFLTHCPRLESFTAQSVDFAEFTKILPATRPRYAAIAPGGGQLEDSEVHSLVAGLMFGNHGMECIEEFSLFSGNTGAHAIDQASVFIDALGSDGHGLYIASSNAKIPRSTPLRRVDIHSPRPIPGELGVKLQALYDRAVLPPNVQVELHYSEKRSGNKCRVAGDQWSTSTGPVTDEWDSTYYPFSPSFDL